MNTTTETTSEPFAIVPQALLADPNISPGDKLIYCYLLAKYQTKRPNGEPWTFSSPSIAKGTGLNERTIQRRIKIIRKQGVLKLHGHLMNGKKLYNVFVFVPDALTALISSPDKMSVVKPNVDRVFETIPKEQPTENPVTADNLSDRMSAKSKMVKEREKKEDGKIKGFGLTDEEIQEFVKKGLPPHQIKAIENKMFWELSSQNKRPRSGFDSLG